jgi:hypothetical protein
MPALVVGSVDNDIKLITMGFFQTRRWRSAPANQSMVFTAFIFSESLSFTIFQYFLRSVKKAFQVLTIRFQEKFCRVG